MKPVIPTAEPSEQAIQHAAYLLWEEAGRPPGRDLEFWLTARERLRHTLHVAAGKAHILAKPAALAARNAQPPGRKKP